MLVCCDCSTIVKDKLSITKYFPKGDSAYRRLSIDVAETYARYKNFVWASNVQIEKLSIGEMAVYEFKRGEMTVS